MAKKSNKKNGGNIKPIDEMINEQNSNAEKFFEKLDENPPGTIGETNGCTNGEQMVEPPVEPLVDEPVENTVDEELHHKIKILNLNIKGAIYYNKDKSTKGITGKQYKSILDGYRRALGIDMRKDQAEYMKRINFEQAKSIIHTMNMFYKEFNYKRNVSA